MFYKSVANIPIFLLILLFFQPLYNAQNSDLVVSIPQEGAVIVKSKGVSGKDLSFCSWLQMEGPYFRYFKVYRPPSLDGVINFNDHELIGIVDISSDARYTNARDCNVKKEDWFHICMTRDQSSINFYFNGYPLQNYTRRDKINQTNDNFIITFLGDNYLKAGTNNFYQSNMYDRVITKKEAMDLSKCESIPGNVFSWANITEKSPDVTFLNTPVLVQKPVPCPNPPKLQRIDCETGEPIKEPGSDPASSSDPASGNGNPCSSMGNSNQDPGSSSGNPSSSMGNSNQDPGSSSGNPGSSSGNPCSSMGNSNQDPGSSSGNPSSAMGNSNQDPGSSSGNPTSSTGNSDQSSGSGGSGNPTSPSPNSGTSSQNLNSGSSPRSSGN